MSFAMFSFMGKHGKSGSKGSKDEPTKTAERLIPEDKFVIVVGHEQEEFMVFVQALVTGNDYFEPKIIQALTEQGHKKLHLKHVNIEVFQAYLQWLYGRRIIVMDPSKALESRSKSGEQIRLANLWDFAKHINDKALQNATLDAFLDTLQTTSTSMSPATVSHLWRNGKDSSSLHSIVMLLFIATPSSEDYLRELKDQVPSESFVSLAVGYAAAYCDDVGPLPYLMAHCSFHEHNDAVPRCRPLDQPTQSAQQRLADAPSAEIVRGISVARPVGRDTFNARLAQENMGFSEMARRRSWSGTIGHSIPEE